MDWMTAYWLLLSLLINTPKGSSARPAPPPSATACEAVTAADIEETLGRHVARIEEHSGALESTCDYGDDNGRVTIVLRHSAAKVDIAAEIANLAAAFPEAHRRDVPGLGMRAFYLDLAGIGTQLNIFRQEHDYLLVSVLGFGEPDQVSAAAGKLARKALARL